MTGSALADRPSVQVFLVFLRLGLTSFGGPVAHLGYFHEAFVQRLRWLTAETYGELVAMCQCLPGPASSQVGFAIGLQRAGLAGGCAAWLGFTLPSAALMIGLGVGFGAVDPALWSGPLRGVKAAVVAVVAWALWQMAQMLAPTIRWRVIAALAAVIALLQPGVLGQLGALLIAAVLARWAGALGTAPPSAGVNLALASINTGVGALLAGALLIVGLAVLPLLAAYTNHVAITLIDSMYRAGSLVFGGGHVVLPLLHAETVTRGMVTAETLLAGYGMAQALPGPLFAFGGWVGASVGGVSAGIVATIAIFLPGLLLVVAVMPLWGHLRSRPSLRRALAGLNAGVVGLVAAALYDPVFIAGITEWVDLAVAGAVLVALAHGRWPSWLLVVLSAGLGAVLYR